MKKRLSLVGTWLFVLGCATATDGLGGSGGGALGGSEPGQGTTTSGTSGNATATSTATSSTGGTTTSTSATTSTSGATTSVSSSSSSGTGGGTTTSDIVLMVAGGGSSVIGSEFDVAQNQGFSYPWLTSTVEPLGLGVLDNGVAVAGIRSATDGSLLAATHGASWSLFTPVQTGLIVAGPPHLAPDGDRMHAVYRALDESYAYAAYEGGVWTIVNEPLGNPAATGPADPSIASIAGTPTVLFVGGDGDLYETTRSGGTWLAPDSFDLAFEANATRPGLLRSGSELLTVFADSGGQLYASVRTAGQWSNPAAIPGAASLDPVSLAELDSGAILLGFRGVDQKPYTAVYSGGAWSSPEGVANPNPTVICPPAISRGATGADAELVWVDTGYVAYWTRLGPSGWSAGSLIGSASPPSCMAVAVP